MPTSISNNIRNAIRRQGGFLLRNQPRLRDFVAGVESWSKATRHTVAEVFPAVIHPRPFLIMIAVTAHCNLRCLGCRYGRDFMPGHQLTWKVIREVLDDAREAGIYKVRFYGGEPLLHPDLPKMIKHCRTIGLTPGVTTNATLLASKIDELFDAGLRDISVGFYGVGESFNLYTQRPGRFRRFEEGISAVRNKYGDQVDMQINWLLRRQTCTPEALQKAFAFAQKYQTKFQVDLVHYSLPYFTEGPDRVLQFRADDRPAIETIVTELLRLKDSYPEIIRHTAQGLRSIPDWLLLGPQMKVPCTAYEMIWVGADGTVQLCYVTFKLGNLHGHRLRDLLFTPEHTTAARGAFALHCPNCHCGAGERVMRHAPTRNKYTT